MKHMSINEYRALPEMAGRHKDPKNQLRGAANRAQGHIFETAIEAACEAYRTAGRADIEKTPEPMRVLRNIGEGKFVAAFEKRAQPDFKGTLVGGRAVCFEAKYTDTDAERIEKAVVKPWQEAALERHQRLGAVCFVMVSFGMRTVAAIPWHHWQHMKDEYGRAYMTVVEAEAFEVPYTRGYFDFLSGMEGRA